MNIRRSKWYILLVPVLVLVLALAGCDTDEPDEGAVDADPDIAETDGDTDADMDDDGEPTDEPMEDDDGAAGAAMPSTNVVLASSLIGQTVNVPTDDDALGMENVRIEEVLIDENGDITSIIIDTGGLFDTGSGLVAVDPSRVALAIDDADTPGYQYSESVTELEQEPIFDLAAIGPGAAIQDDDDVAATYYDTLRASQLTGTNVMNQNDENLGQVNDIVLDMEAGTAPYLVADFGGFLEIDDEQTLVPWGQFGFSYEEEVFILPVDEGTLSDAPTFDEGVFGEYGVDDDAWDSDYTGYWDPIEDTDTFDVDETTDTDMDDTNETATDDQDEMDTETADDGRVIQASALLGENITVPDEDATFDQDMVNIEEILIDQNGDIAAIIIDTGGLFDLDSGLFAVQADRVQIGEDADGEAAVVYTATITELEQEPAFDLAAIGPGAAIQDDDDVAATYYDTLRASRLTGINVANAEDVNLGDVEDVLLNLSTGSVEYMVVDFGGLLDLEDNDVAVPWEQFQFSYEDEEFVLPVDQATVSEAPLFDDGVFGDYGVDNDDWDSDYADYWDPVQDADTFDADSDEMTGDGAAEDDIAQAAAINIALVQNILGQTIEIPVDNGDDETASIEEIFITESGEIEYFAVDTGGLFQPGEPVFAVTSDDIAFQPTDDGSARTLTFVGDVTALPNNDNLDLDGLGGGVALDEDDLGPEYEGLLRVTQLVNTNVENEANENLAMIDDMVVDLDTGMIEYVIADFGGFLGIGEKEIAIPWQNLDFSADEEFFTLSANEATLENAPEFASDWEAYGPTDANWDDEYATYWENELNN